MEPIKKHKFVLRTRNVFGGSSEKAKKHARPYISFRGRGGELKGCPGTNTCHLYKDHSSTGSLSY